MDELKQKIALFIDADNAPASKFEDVMVWSQFVKPMATGSRPR